MTPLMNVAAIAAPVRAFRYVAKSDAVMIRNCSEHNGKEASTHLKSKHEHFKKEIKTPERFHPIVRDQKHGFRQAILIRLKDGKEIPCADWLKTVLKDYHPSNSNKARLN